MNGICQRTSSFARYFNEDDADIVFKVYQTIFGPRGDGPVNMNFPWWPLQVLYGDQAVAGDTINQCAVKPNLEAMCYNDRPDGKGSAIMLCPRLFQRYYRPLRQFECGQIGSYMSENYLTAGSIQLHVSHRPSPSFLHYPDQPRNSLTGTRLFFPPF